MLPPPAPPQFHNPEDEPSCSRTISIPINDNHKFTVAEYREKLYGEIVKRKKALRAKMEQRRKAAGASRGGTQDG